MWYVIKGQVNVDASFTSSDSSWENNLNIMGFPIFNVEQIDFVIVLIFTFSFVGREPQHSCEGQRAIYGSHFWGQNSGCQAWEMLCPLGHRSAAVVGMSVPSWPLCLPLWSLKAKDRFARTTLVQCEWMKGSMQQVLCRVIGIPCLLCLIRKAFCLSRLW